MQYSNSIPPVSHGHGKADPNGQDVDHLRMLSIGYYIGGGLLGLTSLFPIVHLLFGLFLMNGSFTGDGRGAPPVQAIGWLFIIIPLGMMIFGLGVAVATAFAGRHLANRTGYTYCLVVAGVQCLFMPLGTALGVLTFIVLFKPNVKMMFGQTY